MMGHIVQINSSAESMKVLKCILKVVWLIFCILVLRVVYYRESSVHRESLCFF
jgi:hypothetical protein